MLKGGKEAVTKEKVKGRKCNMISMIIPVYNVEKYLHCCLDSVTAQTYKDIEIILVDDGSTDRSGSICDEYAEKDSRITVIHKPNGGLSDARNTGLDTARGEYVCFVDSDDSIVSNAVEKLILTAKREKADIVYFDAKTIFEDFEDRRYFEELERKHRYVTACGAKILGSHLKNEDLLACACLNMYSRDLIEQNGLRFKNIMHEDQLFTPIAYVRAERIAQVKEPLYIRRLRAGSIMSFKDTARSIFGMSECVKSFIAEFELYPAGSLERKAMLLCIDVHTNLLMHKFALLNRSEKKAAIPSVKKVSEYMRGMNYKGSLKVRLKLEHPNLFCGCRTVLLPIKRFFEK